MTPEHRKHIQTSAKMDRLSAVVRDIGEKIEVSEMELVCLCSFAQVGLFFLYSQIEGEKGDKAEAQLRSMLNEIGVTFEAHGQDGLIRLAAATAAILGSEKFSMYDPRPDTPEVST